MAFAAPAIPYLLTAATVGFTTYASIQAQKSASYAADAEADYREKLLARKATDEKNALRENSRIRLLERQRAMAELRVSQAASGMAFSGTALAVFGEIGSRYDDQINEATNQGLDRIASYNHQIQVSKWSTDMRHSAEKLERRNTLIGGGIKLASGMASTYKTFGTSFGKKPPTGGGAESNPFSLLF